MNRIVLTTRVGGDGNVQVNLPVGAEEAGTEVQVTVEPLAGLLKGTLLVYPVRRSASLSTAPLKKGNNLMRPKQVGVHIWP